MKIGILALQGAFLEHKKILDKLGITSIYIKEKSQLEEIDGIILPGGESTAMGKLMREFDLLEPLKEKIINGIPVFGTCSGLILLAKKLANDDTVHLGVMDIVVKRNGYGRQLGSFQCLGSIKGIEKKIEMVFIRAPYVEVVGEGVEVIGEVEGKIIAVKEKNMLGISFHPELTEDTTLHKYFLNMIEKNRK
ncbi:pyridoxal 5'-phosphate synthase glutaminase subunit PdxT [uncultured Fusobacterium sp.]|uniref:pyridoxal 5'-phosphate synthase glutaminase subunit PdxT n=1 Tax=uncultured Fusobacterium sp. TaxID=159267 RepID=UPI0025DE6D05|nr:pyridoxal 5'-phosphate synthase glutaminase subunit PdxT [uncultured Fusobacterium sp.]